MKRAAFLLPLLSLLLMSAGVQSWLEFRSVEGRFKVLAPGTLEEKVTTAKTALGELEYHAFLHQEEDTDVSDNLLYFVNYCDYPEGSIHSDSTDLIDEFFDATIDAAKTSVDGELRYATRVNMKGYPGIQWRVDYNDGTAVIKTKAYLVGNRYYSVRTVCLRDKSLNVSTDKFMDSFKVMGLTPKASN